MWIVESCKKREGFVWTEDDTAEVLRVIKAIDLLVIQIATGQMIGEKLANVRLFPNVPNMSHEEKTDGEVG